MATERRERTWPVLVGLVILTAVFLGLLNFLLPTDDADELMGEAARQEDR